jgi:hypothetical protein
MIFLSASGNGFKHGKNLPLVETTEVEKAVLTFIRFFATQTLIVFGGHPTISPLVECGLRGLDGYQITKYRSAYFKNYLSDCHHTFKNVVTSPAGLCESDSLTILRNQMLKEKAFNAAVFIGGGEGVTEEYSLFCQRHPTALIFPIPNTGGAAYNIFQKIKNPYSICIDNCPSQYLFRKILSQFKLTDIHR